MADRKYKFLTKNFFKGSTKGQINSVYKDRENKPEKVAEFKTALADSDVTLNGPLMKNQIKKLNELGVEIPADLVAE